jgi:hypothetical protein
LARGTAAGGDEIEVTVELAIPPLWEIQPLEAAAGAAATRLELSLPPGVTAVSEWTSPPTSRSVSPDGHTVHVGKAVFSRTLAVAATAPAGPATVSCKVSYQACNERTCLKPQAMELAAALVVVGSK